MNWPVLAIRFQIIRYLSISEHGRLCLFSSGYYHRFRKKLRHFCRCRSDAVHLCQTIFVSRYHKPMDTWSAFRDLRLQHIARRAGGILNKSHFGRLEGNFAPLGISLLSFPFQILKLAKFHFWLNLEPFCIRMGILKRFLQTECIACKISNSHICCILRVNRPLIDRFGIWAYPEHFHLHLWPEQ